MEIKNPLFRDYKRRIGSSNTSYYQYEMIMCDARREYMRKHGCCAPSDFGVIDTNLKLTSFEDEELCRYINSLTSCIRDIKTDMWYHESEGRAISDSQKANLDALVELKAKLTDVLTQVET